MISFKNEQIIVKPVLVRKSESTGSLVGPSDIATPVNCQLLWCLQFQKTVNTEIIKQSYKEKSSK